MGKVLRLAPLFMLAAVAVHSLTTAGEVGFSEDFALATERSEALKQLIPGTEDYYFYHCLHYQNTGELGKVEDLLKLWLQRWGETPRAKEIQNRLALLTYEKDPKKALDFIRMRIGVHYNHFKEELEKKPNLPLVLDQKLISRDEFKKRAFTHSGNLGGFEDSAFDWLVADGLNGDQRRMMLQRLRRPDYPKLADLIVDDLNHQHSAGFGSLEIHKLLLQDQMDEVLKRKADLIRDTNFVQQYIKKLQPNPDIDWQHDAKEKDAYLTRLLEFTRRLAPAHNSLKAHVLYHRLLTDRAAGKYDKDLFMEYLKLPRQIGYMNPLYLQKEDMRHVPAHLHENYISFTLFPSVNNDEELVRDYLMTYFSKEDDLKPYDTFIEENYLKALFAEAKIIHGVGDQEKWYSLLNNPARYQALKDRVDLEFVPQNKTNFTVDEAVSISIDVKNVQNLIVKVFEINTSNYYRENQREVDTTINLDGLVANEEKTHTYQEPALRRVRRTFEFPNLKSAGVYVVDFIGNGKSSRAVVRKGQLRLLERNGAAGQTFTVLDEKNVKQPTATIWMGGRDYPADKNGEVHIPYSTNAGRTPVVIQSNGFYDLEFIQHQAENYSLRAGLYVDRESLLKRKQATLIVRPSLSINGVPIALKLIEDAKLTLTTLDRDGVNTTRVIPNVKLVENEETTIPIQVPENLLELRIALTGQVQSLSLGRKIDLEANQAFTLNHVDRSPIIDGLYLSRTASGYVLNLLGKSGEPRAEKAVNLQLKHRDFTNLYPLSLQTDANGRIELGALQDIVMLKANAGQEYQWSLNGDAYHIPASLHGKTEMALHLPYLGSALKPDRLELSLLERRGDTFVKDWFDKLALKDGFIEISALPPGDYELYLKPQRATVAINITAGAVRDGYYLSESRILQAKNALPLNIAAVETGNDAVKITLKNANTLTRVHVFATRYEPAYDAFSTFDNVEFDEASLMSLVKDDSVYVSGRDIGDELQYILDRKYAVKFPGNMLKRPSLILNPWAIRTTETGLDEGGGGGSFGQRNGGGRRLMVKRHGGMRATAETTTEALNMDFLPLGAITLLNLKADKDGVISIARKDLGGAQHLRIVAVDPISTAMRQIALPETPLAPADQRLVNGLNPQKHFTEQKQVSVLQKGGVLSVDNIATSNVEVYDSLPAVYRLFKTLTSDPKLDEFNFVLEWPKLKIEQKREKYSKYACHELHFFLYQKDPEFFKEVVANYLRNKKDKTFLDHWLLGSDLAPYLQPWRYQRLNTVERVLLAQRLQNDRELAARHVREMFELIPPDMERYNHLFKTALKGSALDAEGDALGIGAAQKNLEQLQAGKQADGKAANGMMTGGFREAAKNAPATAAPPAPSAPALSAAPAAKKRQRPGESSVEDAAAAPADQRARDGDKDLAYAKEAKADALEKAELSDHFETARRGANRMEEELELRKQVRALYRKLDKTEEWAENNYYKLLIEEQLAQLVPVNGFWKDYAASPEGAPFLSVNVAETARNFSEMMFALAVLNLPFEAPKHETVFKDAQMTFTASGPLLVYHKQIRESAPGEKTPILVSQNFFRLDDRYRNEGNERYDKYIAGEFLTHVVYGCQVVLTNPTSSPQKLELLTQIPAGAVPVNNGYYTRGQYVQVQPYATLSYEYHFYFPAAGEAMHYPVHVSKNEKLIANAEPVTLKVVTRLSKLDTGSWQYISQHGTPQDVLKFLQDNNVHRLDLNKIAWRMRDPEFFKTATALLASRHAYSHTLWSYALLHNEPLAAREYLQFCDAFIQTCGKYIDTKLVTINSVDRYAYQHLEYSPLVNARAHKFGKERKILNSRFFEQYNRFTDVLSYRPKLDDDDTLSVVYYLLLQDRIEDALKFFPKVQPTRIAARMQYDYLRAYLDFYSPEHKEARGIALQYKDHPVDRWRFVFTEVLNQLDEIDGKSINVVDKENRDHQQAKLTATEPSFEFKVESRKVAVAYQNMPEVQVRYYLMDVELLFSGSPFVQQHGGQFAYIRPNRQETIKLPADQKEFSFNLPEEFHSANVMVELTGNGQRKAQAYYANTLALQVVEGFGQLKVAHQTTNAPLPKVYVKVYAQMKDGKIQFYRDGYTDLRGRFDYSSLSTNELDNVSKFALLVMSDANGAVVREAMPPKQ